MVHAALVPPKLAQLKIKLIEPGGSKLTDKYQELANAIVLAAVQDYRIALKKLNKNPQNPTALYTKKEVERFFRSDYYKILTSLDPDMLIEKIQAEVV